VLVKLVDGLSTSAKLYHRRARGLERAPSDELFAVVVLDSVAYSRLNFFFKAPAPVASPWAHGRPRPRVGRRSPAWAV